RGAIDLTLVAGQLLGLRGVTSELAEGYPETVYDAMVVALSGQIFLDETVEATPEAVLRQIWEDQFHPGPGRGGPWLKDSAGRLAPAAPVQPPSLRVHSAAPPPQAARGRTAAARARTGRRRGPSPSEP